MTEAFGLSPYSVIATRQPWAAVSKCYSGRRWGPWFQLYVSCPTMFGAGDRGTVQMTGAQVCLHPGATTDHLGVWATRPVLLSLDFLHGLPAS